jgi:hypothetical protein
MFGSGSIGDMYGDLYGDLQDCPPDPPTAVPRSRRLGRQFRAAKGNAPDQARMPASTRIPRKAGFWDSDSGRSGLRGGPPQ